ncbi:MAG: phage tail assembly chaperone [Alphaproteobacteria bacterium]|nr:MAG: phage tail assembly chaperone [Alphaproteobacteria bacterium]
MDEGEIWRRYARMAMGVLGWTPDTFWRATPTELMLAVEGLSGGAPPPPAPLSREEFEALRARFPDR